MADIQQLGQSFVQHYYNTFDTNRVNLAPLYQEGSMLTFEGAQLQGVTAIINKLKDLPFQRVLHRWEITDVQPTVSGGVLIFVSGQLMVDNNERPMGFSQVFHLLPANNSYFVHNDIFRLSFSG